MALRLSRRRFVEITPLAGVALLAACGKKEEAPAPAAPAAPPAATPAPQAAAPEASAAAAPSGPVAETDPQAVALSYVADASKIDKAQKPGYADGSMCGNCALYQGKAGDATGPCPLFGGRAVSAKGWCTSYTKKV